MKYLTTILLFTIQNLGFSQKSLLIPDTTIEIPKLNFDSQGEIVMIPSTKSSQNDFNFLIGKWKLKHRRLKSRLNNSNEWEEFETMVEDFAILKQTGNMDFAYGTIDGKPWEGRTIRLFDQKTRLWSLYWVASNVGVMDPPVVGSFENGIGHFFCKDVFKGKHIIMMFRWDVRDKDYPVWSQAFSPDNGKTWEWNWLNVSHRME